MNKLRSTQQIDTYELLSTKLTPPRLSSSLISREPLLARLDEGLEHKLTLLAAPAGFGKTTLVSEWIAKHTYNSRQPHRPKVAWVALDAGDNDPVRFWRYVITACYVLDEDLDSVLTLLLSPRPHFETILTTFINKLAHLSDRCVLILEDYHVIGSPQIHETLAFLLEHLPANLRLMLLSRSVPSLPLARLRAYDDLYEIDISDLRFSTQEAHTFLQQAIPFPLSAEVLERLEERTEGWITGLRLVALALRGRQEAQDVEHLLATFSGSHRHILEYLVAEVLAVQPELVQEFLLQTTFLSRLSGSLCDALTGRNDSELILERLERANLFLMPLDGVQQWYRYHTLFAEAIHHYARRRLGDKALHGLLHKASLWYEEHGLQAEAIEAALSAQDFERAAGLINRLVAPRKIGELFTLYRWCQQLPEAVLRMYPALCMAFAEALLYTNDRSSPGTRALVERPLAMAESCWQAEQNKEALAEVLALRAQVSWWQGDLAQAISSAKDALLNLAERNYEWRGVCTITVSVEALLDGDLDMARSRLLEGRTLCEAVGNTYAARAAMLSLADICVLQGNLHEAASLYRQVYAEAGEDVTDQAHALTGLAALALEWNDLDAAELQVTQALDIMEPHVTRLGIHRVDTYLLMPSLLLRARVQHARGQSEQARQRILELFPAPLQYISFLGLGDAYIWQIRLALAAGDLAAGQRMLAALVQTDASIPSVLRREQADLLRARLLIAQGKYSEALDLLVTQQARLHQQKHLRNELEIRVLKVMAYCALDSQREALQELREVLVLTQPEGYKRLFLEEGETMEVLLRLVLPEIKDESLSMYVRTLLAAFPSEQAGQAHSPSAFFIEPLSSQERRVLRLLAAGRSNPEMAQELVVSVNTIKTQVKSIFRKLNVNNRQEARDIARQLKLF